MNIIIRELKANMKSAAIWCIILISLIILMLSEFSAYYNNPEMAEILNSIPESITKALSLSSMNLTTVSGFIGIASVYLYVMLCVFAVLMGSSILSKEERDKTAEFLLTLPVSRRKVILGKWTAGVIDCFIVLFVTGFTIVAATLKYKPDISFYRYLMLLMGALFILQLVFLSLGIFLASLLKRHKRAGSFSLALLLGTYILSIAVSLSDKIEFLKYITPFKYFEPIQLLNERRYEPIYIIISAAIIIAGTIFSLIAYRRRDMHI